MIQEIQAKTILNKKKKRDSWFLDEFTTNAYEGCSMNCLYCYVRGSKYGENMEDKLSVKINAPEVLEKQLQFRVKKQQYGFVVLSSATDAYMPVDAKFGMTKKFLELFLKYRFPVHIITKSDLILQDIDLLKKIDEQAILPDDLKISLDRGTLITFSISSLQIDLTQKFKIEKITYQGSELIYRKDLNAVIVKFPETQFKGSKGIIRCYYSGAPIVAKSPPWDGGFVWKKDANNKDWVGVACEGAGASTWWPCKDHLSDEPDSMAISFIVPSDLVCVSNGNLRGVEKYEDGTTKWNWFVSYPINNYNVTLNLADYSHFDDLYLEDRDTLKLDYYVLAANLGQAKTYFSASASVANTG